jgi:hypothetical protein
MLWGQFSSNHSRVSCLKTSKSLTLGSYWFM